MAFGSGDRALVIKYRAKDPSTPEELGLAANELMLAVKPEAESSGMNAIIVMADTIEKQFGPFTRSHLSNTVFEKQPDGIWKERK